MQHLLYADHIRITDAISIGIPTVGEVWDCEDDYYAASSMIISTPYDMMVQLDDAGIDFTTISTFELFCMQFANLQKMDTSLIFGDLDLSLFEPAINQNTNELVLLNSANNYVIDRVIHEEISKAVKRILQIQKPVKKPGNEEAKSYLIRIARMRQRKAKRLAESKETSQLEDLIISLVNTPEFPYTYETIRDISIYQLYASMNQIAHKIRYDHTMNGYYAGTVKIEDLSMDERTWLKS